MPLVVAKCTECGGATEVDNEKKAAVCRYCWNSFIVEEAINNFYTHNHDTHNITNSVVHIHESKSADFVIEAGVLKKYTGASRDVVIPDSVVVIGYNVFSGLPIMSVTVPDSVTSIDMWAFEGCTSLTSVTIPNSVTHIADGAFMSCTSLTSVTIPGNVTHIGVCAFCGCRSLAGIIIPDSVTEIGSSAFQNCSKLMNVKLPPQIGWEGAQGIFKNTPFARHREWAEQGLCQHCGGKLGLFGKCKSYKK